MLGHENFIIWFAKIGKSEIVPRVGSLPMIYLGMPLGTLYKTTSIWNPILKRMEKKLSGWKQALFVKGW